MAHAEQDELSAYLDGELAGPERARVEEHLRGCPRCSAALRALEATLEDVRSLGEPVPDASGSFALRAAIGRERRGSRMYRWVPAAAAAAIAGVAVIALSLGGGEPTGFSGPTLHIESPELIASGVDYDERAAEARVLALAQGATGAEVAGGAGTGGAGPAESAPQGGADSAASPSVGGRATRQAVTSQGSSRSKPSKAALERCVRAASGDEDTSLSPMVYEWATFRGRPAFLLAFGVPAGRPQRVELWVMDSRTCSVLFFAQRRIG